MWLLAACHHPTVPAAAAVRTVEPAAMGHYLQGRVAVELQDDEAVARSARWLLLLDSGPWTGFHAAELLVAAHLPPDAAVDRVLATLGELPPCEAQGLLTDLVAIVPAGAVAQAHAAATCP